jgi:hypothetical protein
VANESDLEKNTIMAKTIVVEGNSLNNQKKGIEYGQSGGKEGPGF